MRIQALAELDVPDKVVEENDDREVITRYTPLGVALAIVPWNCQCISTIL